VDTDIWTPLFCKPFLFDFITSGNAVAPIYPAYYWGFMAPGPDGFPRVSVSIRLPASKALGWIGILKTPAWPFCHRLENA
jgi:hypothetical protein